MNELDYVQKSEPIDNSKFIYVEWCDALSYNDKWMEDDIAKIWACSNEWVVRQSGFIIEENTEYLLLAGMVDVYMGKYKYGNLLKIPKPWIKKRISLAPLID